MITSDLEELNIDQLNEFEGEPSNMLTENPKGRWKKVSFDPLAKTTESTDVLTFHENRIISTAAGSLGSVELTGAVNGSGALGQPIETSLSDTVEIKGNQQVFDLNATEDTTFEYKINHPSADTFEERASRGEDWIELVHDFEPSTPTFCLRTSDSATFRWVAPMDISPVGPNSHEPKISCDSSGNAFVVWTEYNDPLYQIKVSQYDAVTKVWSVGSALSAAGQSAYQPDVKMNEAGIAVAVWIRYDGTNYIIQSSSYDPVGKAWSPSVDLSAAGQNAFQPKLDLDENGNGMAAWYRSDGADNIIQAATYDGGTKAWTTPVNLSSPGENAYDARVGMDGSGNGLAMWSHYNGSEYIIQSSRYDGAAKTWSAAVDVSIPGEDAFEPSLSVISSGDAMAVWTRYNGQKYIVQGSRYDVATLSWEIPVVVSTLGDKSYNPDVSMNASGSALAVWYDYDDSDNIVQSSTYDPVAKTWLTPHELSPKGVNAYDPEVDIDDDGNGVAIWSLNEAAGTRTQSATYVGTGKKWSNPIDLSEVGQNAYEPQVCMKNGQAIAVWTKHNEGSYNTQGSVGLLSPQILTASDSAVSLSYRPLKNVGEPIDGSDAATKNYVDSKLAQLLGKKENKLSQKKEGLLTKLFKGREPNATKKYD